MGNLLQIFRYFIFQLLLIIIMFGYALSTAWAKTYPSFGPLTVREQNPIYLQTLGLTPTRAKAITPGSIEMRLDMAYSNIFEQGTSATNRLDLDLETMRLALHLIRGFKNGFELGVEIPFYHSGGGFLDAFIQDFHNFFHLPNGGRSRVPNNQYNYKFYSAGRLVYNVPSQSFGLGDISIRIKKLVAEEGDAQPGIALFADLKFPTGMNSRGLGNGAFDFGLGMAVEKSYKRIHGYLNVEYVVSAVNNVLENFMYHNMLAYAAAFEVTLLDTWSVIAQLAGSTPMLGNTGIDEWDGIPMNLIIGFKGCEPGLLGGNDLIWQAGFSEDILASGPSVDFTAFLSIGVRFNKKQKAFNKNQWLAYH